MEEIGGMQAKGFPHHERRPGFRRCGANGIGSRIGRGDAIITRNPKASTASTFPGQTRDGHLNVVDP
jgi:hypothetical protein